jgi:regulator of replication initiation timing
MKTVVNITSRIELNNLKNKLARIERELESYYNNNSLLKDENSSLVRKNLLLQEENRELKKLLDEKDIEIAYG